MIDNPQFKDEVIGKIMNPPLPIVSGNTSIQELSKVISKDVPAVIVELDDNKHHIVTRHDLIAAIG